MTNSFYKTTLKNGLRVVAIPHQDTRAAAVFVLVGTGSKYEVRGLQGVSHFLEHMFFKGTKKRPTAIAVTEPIDRVGGMFNAFTGTDYTGYFVKVEYEHQDLALDIVSDIFLNSILPAKEIAKEKGVVIEEIHIFKDNPMRRAETLWQGLLYGDQPAGWEITGSRETVMGLSRKDLLEYMDSQYVARNTVVCVAGRIDPQSVAKKVEKLFSSIPA
ncbi:MAG: insulinase family protein, partial [Candidatus Wildermuthbacteria bacterium]|nr:insulinase family protein [Candidatus Wildermuthbacteria bacterium]